MSLQPISEYFTEAELDILSTIREKHYSSEKKAVTVLLDDYAKATGIFKEAKDPMALLFTKLTDLAIKNIYDKPVYDNEYSRYASSYDIIHDEAFNLMLQKIDEHHFPIEQYPDLVISAANRHLSVLEKMLKYDFDLEQKIYHGNTRSVLDVAHECKFDNNVYPRLRSHQRKISLLKLGILDKTYLTYLMSIKEYCTVIQNYISPEYSIAQLSPESLIISLLTTSLKKYKDNQEESEKVFSELVDKIGKKINLGEYVDVLYEALKSKNTHAVQKLLDNYQFDLAKATYVTNYNSCWQAASHLDNSACLDLVKAYLKKRRLAVSQSFGIDLTDTKLAAFQQDIESYLSDRPESDENKSPNLNLDLFYGSLYITSIRKQDLDTLEYLYTHMTHDKFKGFDYIFSNLNFLEFKFIGVLVKRLHQAGMDINSPHLLSQLFSLYRLNFDLDALKYLKECGVNLNQTITVGTYLKQETTIAKELGYEKRSHTKLFTLLGNQPTETQAQKENGEKTDFSSAFSVFSLHQDEEDDGLKTNASQESIDLNLFGNKKETTDPFIGFDTKTKPYEEEFTAQHGFNPDAFYDEAPDSQRPNVFQQGNQQNGHEEFRAKENPKDTYGAEDLFPDRKRLMPTIQKQKWTAYYWSKPKVTLDHIHSFLLKLDVKKAQLSFDDLSEKTKNSYMNLLTYGAKLTAESHENMLKGEDKDLYETNALKAKIDALSEFLNTILSQTNLQSDEAIKTIRAAYLNLEIQDQNRGTGLYKIHSFFTGKKFINAKGKNEYVKSTVGELAYDFMETIDNPVKEDNDLSMDL